MTVDAATAHASREVKFPSTRRNTSGEKASSDSQPDGRLTGRQREVAFLVARGLTNRQIASELRISENTVANHVARILRKLDATSRSRIVIWFTESGQAGEQRDVPTRAPRGIST